MTIRRWVVHGSVQGVGFRFFVKRHAERLGLPGWVRNVRDGSVEVIAEGSDDTLQVLRETLQRGPVAAQVVRVDQYDAPPDVEMPTEFEVR